MQYPNKRSNHCLSRCDRSKSINRSIKKKEGKNQRFILLDQEQRSIDRQQYSVNRKQRKEKNQRNFGCKNCENLHRKMKERQQHFKHIVGMYHQQMDKLNRINNELRQKLEDVYEREQEARKSLQQMKKQIKKYENTGNRQSLSSQEILKKNNHLQLQIQPIKKGKQPISIRKISQRILYELQSPTFSQLLAGTPEPSNLRHQQIINLEDKQNALKAQFDRLMNECQIASNRSKKITLRKQMASIANQLAELGRA